MNREVIKAESLSPGVMLIARWRAEKLQKNKVRGALIYAIKVGFQIWAQKVKVIAELWSYGRFYPDHW